MDRLKKERLKLYFFGIRPWSRHSLVLLVAGFVYVGIGTAYATSVVISPERSAALAFILDLMPFQAWGYAFIFVGILTLLSSRWPPGSEKWGYVLLTSLSAVWASGYFLSLVFRDAPVGNVTATLVWGLVAFLWWSISGLNNPTAVNDGRG